MNDLNDTYRRLSTPWTEEQLASEYRSAEGHGPPVEAHKPGFARPIALLAAAIPPVATASVAIHVLHALPSDAGAGVSDQLIETAHRNVADGLQRCHRALELDGADHGYSVEEWLATVYDIARPLLESARPDTEPPDLVRAVQEAISWLSRGLIELDEDSTEASTALAEALGRLLAVWVFTEIARDGGASG